MESTIDEIIQKIEKLQEEYRKIGGLLSSANGLLDEKDKEIGRLRERVAELEAELEEAREMLDGHKAEREAQEEVAHQ